MKRHKVSDFKNDESISPITVKRNRRNHLVTMLYTDLKNLRPIAGFNLFGNVTIHTFEYTRHTDMFKFTEIYSKVRKYLISRKNDSAYFRSKLKHFPEFPTLWDKTRDSSKTSSKRFRHVNKNMKTGFFTPVHIRYGITMILYFIGDMGVIKLVVDPALLVASHEKNFDPELYDYTSIAKRDREFWIKVQNYISQFCISWNISGNAFDPFEKWSLTRLDFTANIIVDSHYSIKTLLYYYRKSLKHRNYIMCTKYSGIDTQTVECGNKSQRFTIYNKSLEQRRNHNKICEFTMLRMENKILPRKMYHLKRDIIHLCDLGSDRCLGRLLEAFSLEAPFIMYKSIDTIFVDGDFYSEKAFIKKLKKLKIRDEIKEEMLAISKKISAFSSSDNIKKFISTYSEAHDSRSIYYRLISLQENGISPIIFEEHSRNKHNKLPSVKSLFLSAIINGFINSTSDELRYIESMINNKDE